MENLELVIRDKSPWQKDNCIDPECPNRSTVEIHFHENSIRCDVRCCSKPECVVLACNHVIMVVLRDRKLSIVRSVGV